jgi:phosphatidylinositol glycan class Q protein
MVDANKLLRIFWPSDAPRSNAQGIILGWRNSDLDLFVISIIQDVEVKPV